MGLYCAYLVKLRQIREIAKIIKMIDFRDFRMPGLTCPKIVEIMDFRILRMPDLKCTKMVEIMDFRIFRRSQKPSGPGYIRKHQKRSKYVQKIPPGPLLDAFSSNIVTAFGRSQKTAAAFGRRPILGQCNKCCNAGAACHAKARCMERTHMLHTPFLIWPEK